MGTAWTERTIEESGARLGAVWAEARARAAELAECVAWADKLLKATDGIWWHQVPTETWDELAEALDDCEVAAANLRAETRAVTRAMDELREQGVV